MIMGGVHPAPQDAVPSACETLLLIGPAQTGFWEHASVAPEFDDARPDPLDRWSKRVLSSVAGPAGAIAIFPSDGPPYPPFIAWALRSGAFWASPVGMLVHGQAGLLASMRGALALPYAVPLPDTGQSPCLSCKDRPCVAACPVDALHSDRYDTEKCHNHLDTAAGSDCMSQGCAARRACPVSRAYGRRPEQSAFHMRAFHRTL
mgnify:CR=1 FL=1